MLLFLLKYISIILDHTFFLYLFLFRHLADAFIQSDLQMRTLEAIKINKRAMIWKCYDKSVSLTQYT